MKAALILLVLVAAYLAACAAYLEPRPVARQWCLMPADRPEDRGMVWSKNGAPVRTYFTECPRERDI